MWTWRGAIRKVIGPEVGPFREALEGCAVRRVGNPRQFISRWRDAE